LEVLTQLESRATRYVPLFSWSVSDTLTFATVREDLDFHSLQVLEAGFTQVEEWAPASAERELLYVAISRHLAAHCPTRRSSSQPVAVALRLHKGEEVYAD